MKHTIRAAIFDIDGTLLPHGQEYINETTKNALMQLQNTGITVIIATGRAPFAAKDALDGFLPDYLICATGALIQDKNGKAIFCNYMTQEEMYALVDYCEDYEMPLNFVYDEGYHVYLEFERMKELCSDYTDKFMIYSHEQNRHLQSLPYVGCVYANDTLLEGFKQKYPHLPLRFLPFSCGGGFYDIIHETDDKAFSIERLLEILHLTWQEIAAFGDGLNDEIMLARAGMPVVMENAQPCLKLDGRIIAPHCDENGVAQIIQTYFL